MPALHASPIRARAAALSTCVTLVLASFAPTFTPTLALAAPAEGSDGDAESIFRRGQAKYETADYNGAIELWTDAYALVDSTPENASIKALLIYNLAQAHVKAYELDEDAIHLKQAQQLLQSFRANLELLYEDEAQLAEETAKVDQNLAEIDEMMAAREAEKTKAEDTPEAEPEHEPEVGSPTDPGPTDEGPSGEGKPFLIAGGVALGLGAAFGAVAITGAVMGSGANDISDLAPDQLIEREDRFSTGRTGNALLIVGSVGAGVLVSTGIALLVVGIKRNKSRSNTARLRNIPQLGATFGWGQGGGVTLSGRF